MSYLHQLTREPAGNGNYVRLTGRDCMTGTSYSVTVKKDDLAKYERGAQAKKAFPYLRAEQREFLISGLSPEGWNTLFGRETN